MKLSISAKIFLGFSLLLGIFATLAFFSIREIRSVSADHRSIKEGQIALARLAAQVETHQENRFRDLRRVISNPGPRSRDVLRAGVSYYPTIIRTRIDEMRRLCADPSPGSDQDGDGSRRTTFCLEILERVDHVERLHSHLDDVTALIQQRLIDEDRLGDVVPLVDQLEDSLRSAIFQLNKQINDETDRAVRRAQDEERASIWRVVILTLIAIFVGVVLTFLSARTLAPIGRLVRYARAISRGDYDQPMPTTRDRELAELAEELHRMARSRKDREDDLDRQAMELERAYRRVADLKHYHESVVRSLRTAVVVTDRDLQVTSTNRAAESHWHLGPEVRGQALDNLPLGSLLTERLGPLSKILTEGADMVLEAMPIDEKLADVRVAPLENEQGRVLGLVIALEDVTDAIQTKDALLRSERLAAIGRMSAHVTHEIRNPLSSIGLNAELLLDLIAGGTPSSGPRGSDTPPAPHLEPRTETDRHEARALCAAIGREVDRLTAITDEYLRFARLPRPHLLHEDLGALVRTIGSFVRRDCEAANVRLQVEIAEDLPSVAIDTDQIRQGILNLVRNAKESMPNGGALRLLVEHDQASVSVLVRDSGVGIPQDKLDRIFDPFYSTKLTGTGLGLALTQQIVSEHGARLEVKSDLDKGSEFRMRFLVQESNSKGRSSDTLVERSPRTPGTLPA